MYRVENKIIPGGTTTISNSINNKFYIKWKPVKNGIYEYNSSFIRREWVIELQQAPCGSTPSWVGSQSQKYKVLTISFIYWAA